MYFMIQIRTATPDDAETIAQLNESIHRLHCDLAPDYFVSASRDAIVAGVKEGLAEEGEVGLIAWEGDTPVGYCILKVLDREPNTWTRGFRRLLIDQLSVEPGRRRRGVGRLLMETAYKFARDQEINEIMLEYWANNDAARSFYQSLGFTPLTEKVLLTLPDADRAH
jgi:ribosomal protein S18 acetylase RimI-like enzyme